MDYVRQSMIRAWMRCPLRYKKEYIDKELPHYPDFVDTGTRVHEAVYRYLVGDREGFEKILITEEQRELFERAKVILENMNYSGFSYPISEPKIIPEMHFEEELEGIGKTQGRFDIVLVGKRIVRVIDLKTGWGNARHKLIQATIYKKAAEKIWDTCEATFAFWLLRRGTIEEVTEFLNWEMVKNTVALMKEDTEFKPKQSYAECRYCPYGDTCLARRRKHGKGFSRKEVGITS